LRDKLILYDQTHNAAIAANTTVDLATVDVAEHLFIIEEMLLWSPMTALAVPADLAKVQILIDGEPFPASPSRMHIRAMAERSMANPYDARFARGPFPFGKISLDPVEDTTIKVTPAQKLAVRLMAGRVGGYALADNPIRVMLRGRIADTDAQLQDIYGGSMYQPGGPKRIGDRVSGKVTPAVSKTFPLTIDNAKLMSGATGQNSPKITPFWTYGVNTVAIPATPEYEWTRSNPVHLADAFEEMSFDWTRVANRALVINDIAAYIDAGRGRVFWHQPPLRRPGHLNLFHGWVVDAGFPNLIPGGGSPSLNGMFQGPYPMDAKVLAFNNLTQLRAVADAGTTIAIGDLEMQMRGTHIEF